MNNMKKIKWTSKNHSKIGYIDSTTYLDEEGIGTKTMNIVATRSGVQIGAYVKTKEGYKGYCENLSLYSNEALYKQLKRLIEVIEKD